MKRFGGRPVTAGNSSPTWARPIRSQRSADALYGKRDDAMQDRVEIVVFWAEHVGDAGGLQNGLVFRRNDSARHLLHFRHAGRKEKQQNNTNQNHKTTRQKQKPNQVRM